MEQPKENQLILRLTEELEQELLKRPIVFLNIKLENEHSKKLGSDRVYYQFLLNRKYASADQIEVLGRFKEKYGNEIGQKCLEHILDK
jgi:hypothetical protein